EGVGVVPSDYYITHNGKCPICHEATSKANGEETRSLTPINLVVVVQIKFCSHIFHKGCLHGWFEQTADEGHNATWPLCRNVIVKGNPALEGDTEDFELEE
ncbi:hypothetical protein GQ44DRAFT_579986, partial [Phaeosphaeriaceae sp. PMI808]